MVAGILTIVAALVTFGIWLFKRKVTENEDPRQIRAEAILRADAAIASGPAGEDDINRLVDAAVAPGAGPVDLGLQDAPGKSGDHTG